MVRCIFTTFLIISSFYIHETHADTHSKVHSNNIPIVDIIRFCNEVYKFITGVEDALDKTAQDIESLSIQLNAIPNRILQLGIDIRGELDTVQNYMPAELDRSLQISIDLREIFNRIGSINGLFKEYYLPYFERKLSNSSVEVFINKATGVDDNGPALNALKIYYIFNPEQQSAVASSLFHKINENWSMQQTSSNTREAQNEYLNYLYSLVEMTNLRAFLMTTLGFELRCMRIKDNCTTDFDRIKNHLIERHDHYLRAFKSAAVVSYNEYFHCHPVYREDHFIQLGEEYAVSIYENYAPRRDNLVVSGVRFIVETGVIHLQVEVGRFMPGGNIEPDRWLPLTEIDYKKKRYISSFGNSSISEIANHLQPVGVGLFLHIRNETVPAGHVITGATLEVYKYPHPRSYLKIIFLRAFYSRVNIVTGVVYYDTKYKASFSKIYPRITDRIMNLNSIHSEDDQFVNFHSLYIDRQVARGKPLRALTSINLCKHDDSVEGRAISLSVSTLKTDKNTFNGNNKK